MATIYVKLTVLILLGVVCLNFGLIFIRTEELSFVWLGRKNFTYWDEHEDSSQKLIETF